jgi:pimeloyl-ACP methyl ester carboxylesterase
MSTFVLVHGAWGGATSWRQFAPLLRAQGHEVFTPSLTGLGDRAHLGGPHVNLSTHVADVVTQVEYEDLRQIVLVGHSYGGMVIAGAADVLHERIAHLVFIDAFLPSDGESCFDLGGAGGPGAMPVLDGWRVVRPQAAGETAARPRSQGHPLGTLEEKVRLSLPLEQRPFTRTYIKAGGNPRTPREEQRGAFWKAAERVMADPAWRYIELPTGHGVHREAPGGVAGVLLDLLRQEQPAGVMV